MNTKKFMIIVSIFLLIIVAFILIYPLKHGKETQRKLEKTSFCGDKICDQSENFYNCCDDCGCPSPQYCDETTHKCEIASFNIEEQKIRKLVSQHLNGKTVYSIQLAGITVFNGKPVKLILVNVSSEKGPVNIILGVSQDQKVYDISPLG